MRRDVKDGKGSDDRGSERMGMTRDRKGWEILEETGMNEKGGNPEGWEGKV